jgi:hypothetical protein
MSEKVTRQRRPQRRRQLLPLLVVALLPSMIVARPLSKGRRIRKLQGADSLPTNVGDPSSPYRYSPGKAVGAPSPSVGVGGQTSGKAGSLPPVAGGKAAKKTKVYDCNKALKGPSASIPKSKAPSSSLDPNLQRKGTLPPVPYPLHDHECDEVKLPTISPALSPEPTIAPTFGPAGTESQTNCDDIAAGKGPVDGEVNDFNVDFILVLDESADTAATLQGIQDYLQKIVAPFMAGCTSLRRRLEDSGITNVRFEAEEDLDERELIV